MYREQVELLNETGLHARPASLFVAAAKKYQSDIVVLKDGEEYDAKSMLSVLSMGAFKGDSLIISAVGADEKEAVLELKGLIDANFGEREGSL
jgi:phosphocarrier protein